MEEKFFPPVGKLSEMWSILYSLCIYLSGCLLNLKAFSFRKVILIMTCESFLLDKIVN